MENTLVRLEKLIDDAKKQREKDAVKTLEVFRLTTVQEIERTKKKLKNLCKNNNLINKFYCSYLWIWIINFGFGKRLLMNKRLKNGEIYPQK